MMGRKRKKSVSLAKVCLVAVKERYYEPNKAAIATLPFVLLPFCIRFVLPTVPLPHLWKVVHTWVTPTTLLLLLNLVVCTIVVTSTRDPSKKKKRVYNGGSILCNAFGTYEEHALKQGVSIPLVEPPVPFFLPKRALKVPPPQHPNTPVKPNEPPPLVKPPKPPSSIDPEAISFSHLGKNKSESPAFISVLEVPPTGNWINSYEVEDDASTDDPATDELNAKADDFIQKFKQQLMLQRLQSYRERKKLGK
ncbi:hypothetical protein SUGI_0614490 [Cryptomeria japonica]|uniref:uncharacterized protein LOC131032099 n=1 Tax=Cryptomeria japonica TaxID=3369 RepID=UPI0024148BBA|nr:uncharacterized protein LOC131032099 [Cryptomeria japonica]GLJ30888.1 hypothetical protein SUGI_0614490 [Cryptomeria japonica]